MERFAKIDWNLESIPWNGNGSSQTKFNILQEKSRQHAAEMAFEASEAQFP